MPRLLLLITAISLTCSYGTCLRAAGDYPFTPVPFTQIEVDDAFWNPRLETNRQVTVWYDFQKCEETQRIANFARAGGLEDGGFVGIPFNDSDVVKVIEGAAYALALHPDPKLDQYLDDLIAKIAAAQEKDGYLYTARTLGVNNKFTGPTRWSNLGTNHELYNVGHMYEAAVAHYQATGKRNFLDIAIKNANLICQVFGPDEGQRIDVPGHEEIEIGLVRLYRATGDEKYLRQAKFFIDMRGRDDKRKTWGTYCQDHMPLVEQTEAVGHAVRGGYLYAGVADVAALTGDQAYVAAIDRIWEDVVARKLYLTGNVGQHGAGEGYAGAYKLTNLHAYNETCAAIALALWNHRMFLLHGDAKYVDVLERIIYNGFLAGVSMEGNTFFYPNPLQCDMQFKFNHGSLERSPWFGCSCCPVNVVRFLPSIAGYVYAHRQNSAYVNLFISGSGSLELPNGTVHLQQRTQYPWKGRVAVTVDTDKPLEFALHLRVPGWASGKPMPSDLYRYVDTRAQPVQLLINGEAASFESEKGYAVIERTWQPGDAIVMDLDMPVRQVLANEAVEEDRGRVAFERGPLVYCAEGVDHNGEVLNLFVPEDPALEAHWRPELLGGVTVLEGTAHAAYRADDGKAASRQMALKLIPYYAWCHRGANEMAVWIPRSQDLAKIPPTPTIASKSTITASHCWAQDSLQAINDQQLPQSSGDHSIPRFTWWDHRGTREWIQYDLGEPTEVAGIRVYWFDDTGRGQCRVPESWRLLYRVGDDWKPVSTDAPAGVALDRFNELQFAPATIGALRIEAQLQKEYSGGILEWEVVPSEK